MSVEPSRHQRRVVFNIDGIVFVEAVLVEVCRLVNSPNNFNLNGGHQGRVAVPRTQKTR
jgi:hypothetical protein